jgi:hypothetical protein
VKSVVQAKQDSIQGLAERPGELAQKKKRSQVQPRQENFPKIDDR